MSSAHAFYVVPTGPGVGLTSVCLGLVRVLEREGLRVGFIKPIRQPGDDSAPERSTEFVRRSTTIVPGEPMLFDSAEALLAAGRHSELLQALVGRYAAAAAGADVVIVEGLAATAEHPNLDALNSDIARALDCQVLLVTTPLPSLHALDDRLVPAANADYARRMLVNCPDLQTTLLPEGDHFILWTQEELVRGVMVMMGGG